MSEWFDCGDQAQRTRGIKAAAEAARRGDLVVLPTDTVYGVGADAFSPAAVTALLSAKGRGRDMPVPVLVGSWRTLDGLVFDVPKVVEDLVEAFWPGGLTIIVRHAPSLAWDLGESRGTVAVRMPLHPVAIDVLTETGPMAVSSANRTGHSPATTAQAARDQLGEDIAVYLDGGPCADAVPSTIVDVTGDQPVLRRLGVVEVDRLREVAPDLRVPAELGGDGDPGAHQGHQGTGGASPSGSNGTAGADGDRSSTQPPPQPTAQPTVPPAGDAAGAAPHGRATGAQASGPSVNGTGEPRPGDEGGHRPGD